MEYTEEYKKSLAAADAKEGGGSVWWWIGGGGWMNCPRATLIACVRAYGGQ